MIKRITIFISVLILPSILLAIGTPQNLTATPGDTQITLKWNKNTEADFAKYIIYGGTSTAPTTKVDSTTSISDTTKTITSLTNGTTYFYRLTAVDNSGNESGYSNEVNTIPIESFTDISTTLTGLTSGSTTWGDYDNDGDLDILLTGQNDGGNYISNVYRNDGGTFTNISAGLPGVNESSAAWGDFDNDGDLDILLAGWSGFNHLSRVYRNDGGSFVDIGAGLNEVRGASVVWGDYDNDGDLDILLAGNGSGSFAKIYRNDNGSFTDISAGLQFVLNCSVAWGDYDNDGDLDILLTGDTSESPFRASKVYRNDNGSFIDISAGLPAVGNSSVAWGDYDSDGDLDILLTGNTGTIYISNIYRNDSGSFVDISAGLPGVSGGSADWGDYDNDGDLDILLTGGGGSSPFARVYKNNDGSFADISAGLQSVDASSATWGDYDNDGDLDILLMGNTGGGWTTKLYRNNIGTANTAPTAPSALTKTVSGNSVTLSWAKSTDTQTSQNGLTYNLRVGSTSGGIEIMSPMAASTGFRKIPVLGNVNHATSWTIKDLPNGIHYWSVQAIDNAFAGSAFATEESFTIDLPPAAPTGLTATSGNQQVNLNWNQNTESDFAKYIIYSGTSASPSAKIDSTTSVSNTTKTITGLTNGTTYYYRITAVDTAGNESGYSNEVSVAPQWMGPVWYVDEVNGSNNGEGSLEYPVQQIQSGIDLASSGDTVLVLPGRYKRSGDQYLRFATNNIMKNIVLKSSRGPDSTIIDGEGGKRLFEITNGTDTTTQIIGFKIVDAKATDGAGSAIYIDNNSAAVFRSCIIDSSIGAPSSAVYLANNVYGRFVDCIIQNSANNSADNAFGGAFMVSANSELVLNRCRVLNNSATSGNGPAMGAGVYSNFGTENHLTLINTIITDNSTHSSNPSHRANGAGIAVMSGKATIINSTIANNNSSGNATGAGIDYDGTAGVKLTVFNSIIYGNTPTNDQIEDYGSDNSAISYSILHNMDPDLFDDGNLNVDPEFADATYVLHDRSPAIGAGAASSFDVDGNAIYAPSIDITGGIRPNPANSNPDMGAYENSLSTTPYPAAPANIVATPHHKSITLQWNASDSTDVVRYFVYISTDSITFTRADTVDGRLNTTSTLTGLTNGTKYYLYVTSFDSENFESARSNTIAAVPLYVGPVWHVDAVNGSNNGEGSLEDPMQQIQDGIDLANSGDTVLVLPGRYERSGDQYLRFATNNVMKNIVLKSSEGPNSTIIDGEGGKRLFEIRDGTDTTTQIIGFKIVDGKATDMSGSAILIDNSAAVFRNCIIDSNNGNPSAAVFLTNNGYGRFVDCFIQNNTNTYANNYEAIWGGAFYVGDSELILNRCQVLNNSTNAINGDPNGAGGIYIFGSNNSRLTLINTIVAENSTYTTNSTSNGGGIAVMSGQAIIINSTIANNNSSENGLGSGIVYDGSNGTKLTVFNSIIYGNTPANDQIWGYGSSNDAISYSILDNMDPDLFDDGNLNIDPGFADTTYVLHDRSPAIGAGAASSFDVDGNTIFAPGVDITGGVRPNPANSNPDMGAYENSLDVTPYPAQVTGVLAYGGSQQVTLTWDANSEADISYYKIYMSTTPEYIPAAADSIGMVEHPTVTYTATGLDNATRYYFNVSALDSSGYEGQVSVTVDITPEFSGPVWWVATDGAASNDGSPDSPYSDLSTAISKVSAGDTIMVKPGTYSGPNNRGIVFGTTMNFVIMSEFGADTTILDAGRLDRHFSFNAGEDSTFQIIGFTLRNGGTNDHGGSISINSWWNGSTNIQANPIIKDCIFEGNQSYEGNGGAVKIVHSSPRFINCTFKDNSTQSGGGAVRIIEANQTGINEIVPLFSGCIFISNEVNSTQSDAYGGAVWATHSSPIFMDCVFDLNLAQSDNNRGDGGAVALHGDEGSLPDEPVRFTRCIFRNNKVVGGQTGGTGGALFIRLRAVLKSCLIVGNEAQGSEGMGGGITISRDVAIINSTIADNSASGSVYGGNGGGLYVDNGQNIMFNNIIWGNSGSGYNENVYRPGGNIVADYNNIEDGDTHPWFGPNSIVLDPAFEDTVNGDYRLSNASPCIGQGTTTFELLNAPAEDILGGIRPNPAGSNPDMGAYEHRLWEAPRQVYYVDDNGNDSNDGLTPVNALLTIQEALTKAAIRDTVELAAGTYSGSGNRDVSLNGITRVIRSADGPANTIIDCENLGRGFVFENGETDSVLISGITIKNGAGDNGGAVSINGADPRFENMIFQDNSAPSGSGGAVYATNSLSKFTNCVFKGNRASVTGAVAVSDGGITMDFCTAVDNRGDNDLSFSGELTISNSIIWHNSPVDTSVSVTYSDVMGGNIGVGNYNGRPGFVDEQNSDFHLQDWSPVIGQASGSSGILHDIEGNSRLDSIPDMGAYENALDAAGTYTTQSWFVATTGLDSASSGNSNTPFRTIQYALDHAIYDDDVNIAAGAYGESLNNWGKGITITGNSGSPSDIEILGQVQLNGGSPTLTNMRIYNASANAVVVSAGSVNLSYLLIDNSNGKGITITDSSNAAITNVTVYNNGYGIDENTSGAVTVTNAIIWDNTIAVSGIPTITYSDVGGGYTGTGNINSDPLFAGAGNNDFALQISSPCIDTGDPSFTYDNDSTVVDMGAFPLVREFFSGTSPGDGTNYTVTGDGAAVISTDFTLSAGDSLTIDAGATVYFDPGVSLNIYGVLGSSGDAGSPILFQGTYSDPDSAFGGVIINVSGTRDENYYAYMFIEDVESGSIPLTINGSATLDHITIAGNGNTTTSLAVSNGTVELKYSILEGAASGTVNNTGSFTNSTDQFAGYGTGDFTLLSSAAAIDLDSTENWIDPDNSFADAGSFYHDQTGYASSSISVLYPLSSDTILVSPDSSSLAGNGVTVTAQIFNILGHYMTNPSISWGNAGFQNGSFADDNTIDADLRGRVNNTFYTSTTTGDLNSISVNENSTTAQSGYFKVVPGVPDSIWVNEQTDMNISQLDTLDISADIKDQFGNVVSDGKTVYWSIIPVVGSGAGFSLSADSSLTVNGFVSVTLETDPTGNNLSVGDQVRVEATSGTGVHQSALISIIPDDIYNLTMPPELTEAQINLSADIASIEIQAAMIDTFDNPLEGVEVNWEVVTGAGTGENLSAASTFTNTEGVALVTLNTSTVADRNYTVRGWVTDDALLSVLMGNSREYQQNINLPDINHKPKKGRNKKEVLFTSNREINMISLPVRIVDKSPDENNLNRDNRSIYDLDDTTAVIHVIPGVTNVVSLPPASVDVLLGDQFRITANVVDQSGNTVADGTPVTWEIVPTNNYVTIENLDAVTTNGLATIDLLIEQTAPWDFDFVVQLTSEGATGATGTYTVDDVTPPESVTNLTVNPNSWTSINDFTLTWTNPAEHSGVAGAHYSIDGSGDTYVTGDDINTLQSITLPVNAASTFDVWLEDNAANHINTNAVSITAKWDNVPPTAFNVTTPLEGWYSTEFMRFEWNASSDATAGLRDYIITIDGANEYIRHPDSTATNIPDAFTAGTHTWTISVFDSTGNETVTSNPQTFFVDFTSPTISHNPVLEGTENSPANIAASFTDDASGIDVAELYYRKGGDVQWQTAVDMKTLNTYQIASSFVTSSGVEYYIYSRDIAGNETYKPSQGYYSISVTIQGDGLSSTDRWPMDIPNGSAVTSYQLLSFPGQAANATPNDILVDDLQTYDNTKWRFFTYSNNSWKEFETISTIDPGVGYFLIVKDAGFNITTGPTRTVTTDSDFTINLTVGDWTMFGNPFDFSIPLENVYINESTNLVSDVNLLTYDGSFAEATEIEPWKGYIYKSATASKIYIKPRKSNGGLAKQIDQEIVLMENEWLVDIKARNGLGVDEINTIGVMTNALDEYDEMDAFEPPMLPGGVSLRMNNNGWAQNPDIYTKDIRSIKEDGEFWDMKVAAEDDRYNVYLNFDGIADIPEEFDVFIIDVTIGVAQDLRWNKRYRYAVSDPTNIHDLRFIAGTREFLKSNNAGVDLYPDRYSISQNYPNPFNPQTSILITLEDMATVDLIVYNILGEEVIRIIDNELRPAGYHNMIWKGLNHDGKRVASGIYFYTTRIKGISGNMILNKTNKMIMVK